MEKPIKYALFLLEKPIFKSGILLEKPNYRGIKLCLKEKYKKGCNNITKIKTIQKLPMGYIFSNENIVKKKKTSLRIQSI